MDNQFPRLGYRGRSLLSSGDNNLIETNPYSSPSTKLEAATVAQPNQSSLRCVRVLFYFHIAVVCWFAAFTLSDTGQIKPPEFIKALFYFRPLQIPFLLTWMACPVWIAIEAWKIRDRSTKFRMCIVIGDVLLSALQVWVMLPLVQ